MARPIQATVSLAALRHNYGVAKKLAAASKVFAVVKANGYGHGIERVTRALAYADGFGTVELDGAVAIRQRGFTGPILLLEGFFEASELAPIFEARLSVVIHEVEQIRLLETIRPGPLDIYFKVNTGMNRLGFAPADAHTQLERLRKCSAARSVTLMTHFATADGPEGVADAMRRFDEATKGIALPRTLANSAATFAHPESHADIVRPGIATYGATPFSDRSAESLGLKPAMTLTSQLIAVQNLAPGETIGYGGTFKASKAMRVGVIACGYADGYPRHAPAGTPVLVNGVRAKTAGRVSMDMITVDLEGIPNAHVGTPVTLWGEGLPVDEVAQPAGTVGYELLCAVAPRVPFVEA